MLWFVQYPFCVQKSGGNCFFFPHSLSLSLLLFLHPRAVIFCDHWHTWPSALLICAIKILPTFVVSSQTNDVLINHFIPWLWLDASLNFVRISSRGGALMRLTLLNNAITQTSILLCLYWSTYVPHTVLHIQNRHIHVHMHILEKEFPHRSIWAALMCSSLSNNLINHAFHNHTVWPQIHNYCKFNGGVPTYSRLTALNIAKQKTISRL